MLCDAKLACVCDRAGGTCVLAAFWCSTSMNQMVVFSATLKSNPDPLHPIPSYSLKKLGIISP